MEKKIGCRTPAEGRDGVTNIPEWKFECLRRAILKAIGENGILFSELKEAVRGELTQDELSRLGSLGWHLTCVKLELEVRGEVVRAKGTKPQFLQLAPT